MTGLGGRLIHPFNIQSPNSDPFGFYEEDRFTYKNVMDICRHNYQLKTPPVDDEEYVPGTI